MAEAGRESGLVKPSFKLSCQTLLSSCLVRRAAPLIRAYVFKGLPETHFHQPPFPPTLLCLAQLWLPQGPPPTTQMRCLIIASDGIWDHLSNEAVVALVERVLRNATAETPATAVDVCETLISAAIVAAGATPDASGDLEERSQAMSNVMASADLYREPSLSVPNGAFDDMSVVAVLPRFEEPLVRYS